MKIKYFKFPIILAIFYTLQINIFKIDRLFFSYNDLTYLNFLTMLLIKVLTFFILVFINCFVMHILCQIKNNNLFVKRGMLYFIIYFSVLMILIFILWPGTWSNDSVAVVNNAHNFKLFFWQHFLSSIFVMVALQIFPSPGFVIIFTNFINAIIVAYVVATFDKYYDIKSNKYLFLKLIPFLLPPVIFFQFSGYRFGIYIFLELLFFVLWMDIKKNET